MQSAIIQVPASGIPIRVTEGPSDWLTPTIQIAVAVFSAAASAAAIIWQMRKQREQAEHQHKKTVKADLQLDAYRDFQRAYAPMHDGWTPASELQLIRSAVAMAISQLKSHGQQQPVQERTARFMQGLNEYSNKAVTLVFFLERYESLLPGFDIFKTAIGSALHDIRQQTIPVQTALMKWLPLEHPNSSQLARQFISCPVITEEAQVEIVAALAPLDIALSQLNCWTLDLSVDIQNKLLGEYAEQKVKQRNAPDQTYFTVTAAPEERARLEALFDSMPWGRVIASYK